MTHRTLLAFASIFGIVFALSSASIARADAAADLTAGRADVEAGDLDKALGLLTAAAQALPQSVEAQLALADCYLKLGQTEKALEKYQAVLKLSPDHAGAKRIVEGLTGSRQTAAQKLALANAFLELGAYAQAEATARQALALPGEVAQKAEARLTLTRVLLFANNPAALDEAVRLIQGGENSAEGRVLAALALLGQAEPNLPRIKELLMGLPAAPVKRPLNDLAALLVQLEEGGHAADVSSKLANPLKAVPPSPFRTVVLNRLIGKHAIAAHDELAHGNISGALEIVWPMVGSGAVPTDDAVLKPVELKGGWIDASWDKGGPWVQASRLLAEIGRADAQKYGSRAALLGSWLAAETIRQATVPETRQAAALELAAGLAGMSRPDPNRKPGDPLSRADEIQTIVLWDIGGQLTNETQQNQWIDLAAALVTRYEAAGDAETGLESLLPVPGDARKIPLKWTGATLARWLHFLAQKSAAIGAKQFQEAAATLAADANKGVNVFDLSALMMFGKLLALHPEDPSAAQQAHAIIDRYLAAEQFDAATAATKALYAEQPGKAGEWALLRLKLRRLQLQEQKLLAGNRQLEKELNPLAKEALAAAFKELTDNPTKQNRHAVIHLLDALVHRYASLERRDLADAVIALAADAKLPQFDDWLLWTKANLQGREAARAFAAAAPDFRSPGQLKLWQAATYLGELDVNYGFALLTPLPPPQTGAGDYGGGTLAVDGYLKWGVGGLATDGQKGIALAKDSPAKMPPASGPAGGGFGGAGGGAGFGKGGSGSLTLGGANGVNAGTITASSTPPGADAFDQAALYNDDSFAFDAKGEKGDIALAMIRQAEQKQLSQIAMLRDDREKNQLAQAPKPQGAPEEKPADPNQPGGSIALPSGPVLSEAEMKRQDDAADKAYAILIDLVKTLPLADAPLAENARSQIVWMFSFFEGQLRTDRTVALVKRFLTDRPTDPQKVQLAFRALQDQLAWAAQRQRTDRVNKKWLDARHDLFEAARKDISQFVKDFADKSDWVGQARLLAVDSFEREAQLAAAVSPVRSAGLLVNSVDALLALYRTDPAHPAVSNFPQRMWNVADRLRALRQEDLGVYVLSQIPIYFPTNPLAQQAVLRIAELYATNLTNPLRAVETYQEYLSVVGDNEAIRAQIFSIAQQLAAKQRFLEALHVYGVFVDSFPTDARAPQALLAIGQIHQSNEVWKDALAAYQRILDEFPNVPITPQVKLAMAECHINLSDWNDARQLYNEFIQAYPQDGQIEMAKQRMEILKNLNRYQTLLADKEVQRNKDDAQFQIGMIVNERLGNHVKAAIEFRKVVKDFPKSSQAAAAQYEIGKALLALNKLDEARIELLKVPQNYPNSPFANDALYYVGQSYEHQAQKLAGATIQGARAEAYEVGQRAAYSRASGFNMQQEHAFSLHRDQLKKEGKANELELDEAANAWRQSAGIQSLAANASVAAEQQAETLSALQVANRQDRINEAYRQAVAMYARVANEYPLGDMADKALLRMAQILETELKDRELAMQTYQKVVKFFPGTPVAEDAAWKVAKFYEAENKYKEAVDAYRDFIRNYPASARVPDAQYSVAEDLEQLGRWVEAMDAYETFRQKFAAHPKAQAAQEEINWIRAYRK